MFSATFIIVQFYPIFYQIFSIERELSLTRHVVIITLSNQFVGEKRDYLIIIQLT